MRTQGVIVAKLPFDLAAELVDAGVATMATDPEYRGAAEVIAVVAVTGSGAAATAVTLLQAPSTLKDVLGRLRRRRAALSVEITARHGSLTIELDEVPDDAAVAKMVAIFLGQGITE